MIKKIKVRFSPWNTQGRILLQEKYIPTEHSREEAVKQMEKEDTGDGESLQTTEQNWPRCRRQESKGSRMENRKVWD